MAELAKITRLVQKLVKASSLGKVVSDVALEPDQDEFGAEFLRINLTLAPDKAVVDDDLERLMRSIEDCLIDIDSRPASVRFPDAA